jgi:hypothetical protein
MDDAVVLQWLLNTSNGNNTTSNDGDGGTDGETKAELPTLPKVYEWWCQKNDVELKARSCDQRIVKSHTLFSLHFPLSHSRHSVCKKKTQSSLSLSLSLLTN